ncbi:MAG: protein kinase [Chloroflexota bacterium]
MSQLIGRALGPYELHEVLGRGGMGTVYRAVHTRLDRECAVKVLPAHLAADESFVQRFRREATIAGSLRHPNIVRIYDVGEIDEIHFIVMELLDGIALRDLLAPGVRMPWDRAMRILRQLASALDHAHSRSVIHRDIKPGNIIVGPDDHVTLVDFGIARASEGTRLTQTGLMVGTPAYMAPEVITGRGEGDDADRYALGVVAYELLTGVLPFGHPEGPAMLYAIAHREPSSPREHAPDLPESAERAILKQIAKEPSERYPTASAFVDALGDVTTPLTVARPASAPVTEFSPITASGSTSATSSLAGGASPTTSFTEGFTKAAPATVEAPQQTRSFLPVVLAVAAPLLIAGGVFVVIFQGALWEWTPWGEQPGPTPIPTRPAVAAAPTTAPTRPPTAASVPPTSVVPVAPPSPAAQAPTVPPSPVAQAPTAVPPPPTVAAPGPADRVQEVQQRFARQDFGGGLAIVEELRRVNPPPQGLDALAYDGHVGLGRQLLDRGDIDGADKQIAAAMTLRPNEPTVLDLWLQSGLRRNWLVMEANWGKNEDAAIEALEQIMKLDPDYRDAREKLYALLISRGDRLAGAGDRQGATIAWSRARELQPDRPEATQRLQSLTPTPVPARPAQPSAPQTNPAPSGPARPPSSGGSGAPAPRPLGP